MKFRAVRDHLTRCYRAGLRTTHYLEGPPGIGKTACAEAAAVELRADYSGFRVVAWPMPVIDPLDFGGLPAVLDRGDGAGPYATRLPFKEIVPTEGCGFLVLDDLPTAPPLTQASGMRLIWERNIGGVGLGEGWQIIATGNRAEDRAATQRIPTPVVSKMGWIEFEPDLEGWNLEMAGRGRAPVVRAFLAHRPDLFVNFDPARPGPFATARTWEALAELCDAYGAQLPPFEAMKGWVGEGPAIEFQVYAGMAAQLVSPDTVLLSPDTAPVPEDPGALYAVTSALSAKATASNFDRLMIYLRRLMPEFSIYTVKSALAAQQGRLAKLGPEDRRRTRQIERTSAFVDFAGEYQDLLA